MDTTASFAAAFAGLYAAHQVADHWVQTQHQADHKGRPGWPGRIACLAHVTTYTATGLLALVVVAVVTGLHLRPVPLAVGLAVSAVSHYIADRRTPLKRIADLLGSGRFHALGAPRPGHDDNPSLGTGAYALDQSWHIGFLFAAALIIA
ncbi:DUF3307 domain-containing protein [Catellatospora coxensis]|uniref:Uncharacterized protein n=1 Tax=Catellatospora coxensis TaxID=310354 RepID=A0A8J3L9N6_9ACTN|nr:DUF3307 domain-containing protein [Catellatospora coxensis]GIG11649.1 hypothetical protein Cco03nite_83490 [Catellatospora coxensis]